MIIILVKRRRVIAQFNSKMAMIQKNMHEHFRTSENVQTSLWKTIH